MEDYLEETTEQEFAFEPEPTEEPVEVASSPDSGASVELAINVLRHVHESVGHVIELLEAGHAPEAARNMLDLMMKKQEVKQGAQHASGSRVVEGVFNGLAMIGSDGREYQVPANYASKSRLVEGDVLKLTIGRDGRFLYKQIAPVARRRVTGCLALDTSCGDHIIVCGDTAFKLLQASVSYYRGEPGDHVVAFVPKTSKAVWAAVDSIVKN